MAQGARRPADANSLGRRTPHAGARPGPHVQGRDPAHRRAVARPRAPDDRADLRQHPQGQSVRHRAAPRRRERQPCRGPGRPRLPAGDRLVRPPGAGRHPPEGPGPAGELPRMTLIVQAIWGGVLFGAVYGLMALGLTLVWGAVRFLNLAHGAIFTVGAYAAYWVVSSLHLPILIALPIGVLVAAAFSYLMHLGFIRPVLGKPGFDNSTLIATVGISIAVSAAAILIFNPEYKVVPAVIPGYTILSGVQITYQGLLVIAVSLALFALVFLFLTYTRQGMAIRAVSQQMEAASLMSIPVERTYAMIILMLILRPNGLFGIGEVRRL